MQCFFWCIQWGDYGEPEGFLAELPLTNFSDFLPLSMRNDFELFRDSTSSQQPANTIFSLWLNMETYIVTTPDLNQIWCVTLKSPFNGTISPFGFWKRKVRDILVLTKTGYDYWVTHVRLALAGNAANFVHLNDKELAWLNDKWTRWAFEHT